MFTMQLAGGIPIYEQLADRITELIRNGTLSENEKLPAVREVAKTLGINPNTVQKAYATLEQRGLTYSIPAKGSYVAKNEKTDEIIRRKALYSLEESLNEAFSAGVSKSEIIGLTEKIYERNENK